MRGDEFHPDLRAAARWLPRAAFGRRTLPLVRRASALMERRASRADVEIEPVGRITVRVHRAASSSGPTPAMLWIHGGGYVMGAAATDDDLCRRFADRLGITVAAVDYRLAPEYPYPVPVDDCFDALTWLADQPDIDPSRLAVGGASAGGGLAAATALLARDRAVPTLAFQLLVYPMLDDRTATRPDSDHRSRRLWNNRANHFGWRCYLGHDPGRSHVDPRAAPGREEDLSGLPPTWLGVGTLDLFHDENVDYANRLRAGGVRCVTEIVPGAFHGFDMVCAQAEVSKAFFDAQVAALEAALG